MWWVFFKYVRVITVSVLFGLFFTTSVNAWSSDISPDFKHSEVKVYHSNPCPGNYGTIAVSGEGSILACIMGENTKVASYFPAQGGVAYAVRFPFENSFYRLDVCQSIWGCVYAEQNDTFVGITGIYKNFVRNLTKNIQYGNIHYSPNVHSPLFSLSQFTTRSIAPQTVASSQNGKWALFELRSYGFFRINVQTSEVRRIIAPGIDYGYGNNPSVEMAISNDGSTVLVAGLRMGLRVVAIDETCGDTPNEFMQTYYTGAVTACKYLPISVSNYIPDFVHASRPTFTKNGNVLSFDAFSKTSAARHITLFSDTNTHLGKLRYLALGDSFTSGEGETDSSYYLGGATNKCHVSTRSYPFLLAKSWNVFGRSTACSGATIQAARGQSANSNQPSQLMELESQVPDIATIGLGGNDAGLIGKLKDCLGLDTCKWAGTAEDRRNTALEIKNLFPRLKEFYLDMKIKTLGPVIVVGYPRIVSEQPICLSTIGIMLNQTERKFMNEAIHYLNQVVYAATIDSGVQYVDVENAFSGGELCTSFESSFMNAFRAGGEYPNITALPFIKIIGSESFHPKPEGHVKIATMLLQKFSDLSAIKNHINIGAPTNVPVLGSYWDAGGNIRKLQRVIPFLNKTTIKKKDVFEISFPAFSFKPSSDIVLELHSKVKHLGTVQSAEDGSLNVTISTDDFEVGFHSVHAIGKNYAENDIDTYDFLTVEEDIVAITTTDTPSIVSSRGNTKLRLAPPDLKDKGAIPMGVLGASIVSAPIPNSEIKTHSKDERASKQRENPVSNYGKVFLIPLLILIFTVTGISLYVYNRQKQLRNPS